MRLREDDARCWHPRRLGVGDEALLRALNDLYADAFEQPECYRERPPGLAYLARLLANDDLIVLVVQSGDALLGGLTAYRLHKHEQERSEIYIYDLAVVEDRRRQGMARALIHAVIEIAQAGNTWAVFVQADAQDEAPIRLYASYGYEREDAAHFDVCRRGGVGA